MLGCVRTAMLDILYLANTTQTLISLMDRGVTEGVFSDILNLATKALACKSCCRPIHFDKS